MVGLSFDATGKVRGFLWHSGVMADLNTLIPPRSQFFVLEALGINDHGQIAGYGQLSNGEVRAYMLTPCDDDHPDIEGCDYSMVDGSDMPATQMATTASRYCRPIRSGS